MTFSVYAVAIVSGDHDVVARSAGAWDPIGAAIPFAETGIHSVSTFNLVALERLRLASQERSHDL